MASLLSSGLLSRINPIIAEITEEAANKLADKIAEALPEIEVEVYPGGQPIYYYIASVE